MTKGPARSRPSGFRYAILGAGRQGTAAGYDLGMFGEASEILFIDADEAAARSAAARVARLLSTSKTSVKGARADAADVAGLSSLLKGRSAVLSALPYRLNPGAAKAAVQARVPYADLGCHLETTKAILKLNPAAKKAGITVLPDCGLAPGLSTALALAGMEALDIHRDVTIFVGGLPQKPKPPLGYKLVYNVENLLALYLEPPVVLRRGKISRLEPLSEREIVEFDGLGTLEAVQTGGGASTCPWSFEGKLQSFEYKTLRYPGHFEKMAAFRDLGFLDEHPVEVGDVQVIPRELFLRLVVPRLESPADRDLVVLRVRARGAKNGRATEIDYDLLDYGDPDTGFSAMERTTGFSAAAVLWMQAAGRIKAAGALPLETVLPAKPYLAEVKRRGLKIQERIKVLTP